MLFREINKPYCEGQTQYTAGTKLMPNVEHSGKDAYHSTLKVYQAVFRRVRKIAKNYY